MTAINVFRQLRAVHVIADGASFGPPGQTLRPSGKLWPLPHLPAIVGGRGPKMLMPLIADCVGTLATSYDELKLVISDGLRAYLPQLADAVRLHAEPSVFDLVVAGVSAAGVPDCFILCSHDRHTSIAPWSVTETGALLLMPWDDGMQAELDAALDPGAGVEDLVPEVDGLRILEIQRARAFADGTGGHWRAGGFAQVMSLADGVISTRVMHRWPAASPTDRP